MDKRRRRRRKGKQPVCKAKINFLIFRLLVNGFHRSARGAESFHKALTDDIADLCIEFFVEASDQDEWNLQLDQGITYGGNNTKLIVKNTLHSKERMIMGNCLFSCSDLFNRKLWRIRVRRVGKRPFCFHIGIANADIIDETLHTLRIIHGFIHRGSIASSDWQLNHRDVISILYHLDKVNFAVNDRICPLPIECDPAHYRLVTKVFDAVELQILSN